MTYHHKLSSTLFIAALLGCPTIGLANSYGYTADDEMTTHHDNLVEAVQNGKMGLQFRLRYEDARESSKKTAKATTLKSQLSYKTGTYSNLTGAVTLTDVTAFFGQKYNPEVTELSKPEFSTVRDPKGTGLTQAEVAFSGLDRTRISVGRQAIKLDNERYLSTLDFRQYPQSFDAISLHNQMIDDLSIYYAYAHHVNTPTANGRTSEGRRKMNTHLLNIGWDAFLYGKLIGYVYMFKDKEQR